MLKCTTKMTSLSFLKLLSIQRTFHLCTCDVKQLNLHINQILITRATVVARVYVSAPFLFLFSVVTLQILHNLCPVPTMYLCFQSSQTPFDLGQHLFYLLLCSHSLSKERQGKKIPQMTSQLLV